MPRLCPRPQSTALSWHHDDGMIEDPPDAWAKIRVISIRDDLSFIEAKIRTEAFQNVYIKIWYKFYRHGINTFIVIHIFTSSMFCRKCYISSCQSLSKEQCAVPSHQKHFDITRDNQHT